MPRLSTHHFRARLCFLGASFNVAGVSAQNPELVVQTGHARGVNWVAFSSNRVEPVRALSLAPNWIATRTADSAIQLWSLAGGKLASSIVGLRGAELALSGNRLAADVGKGRVQLWDFPARREIGVLQSAVGTRLLL